MDELNPTFRFKIADRLVEEGSSKYIHRSRHGNDWCLRFTNHNREEAEISLAELEENLVRARQEARAPRDHWCSSALHLSDHI